MEGSFSTDWGVGSKWRAELFLDDSSALHLLCTYFYHYCISSTSDHQALDPGGWGPLI